MLQWDEYTDAYLFVGTTNEVKIDVQAYIASG